MCIRDRSTCTQGSPNTYPYNGVELQVCDTTHAQCSDCAPFSIMDKKYLRYSLMSYMPIDGEYVQMDKTMSCVSFNWRPYSWYTHTHTHACTYARTHARMRAHTHTHIHTHTCTHAHTHMTNSYLTLETLELLEGHGGRKVIDMQYSISVSVGWAGQSPGIWGRSLSH